MLNRENFKSFIIGVITYFVLSVVLDLLNIDYLIVKAIILLVVLLIVGFSYKIIKKNK